MNRYGDWRDKWFEAPFTAFDFMDGRFPFLVIWSAATVFPPLIEGDYGGFPFCVLLLVSWAVASAFVTDKWFDEYSLAGVMDWVGEWLAAKQARNTLIDALIDDGFITSGTKREDFEAYVVGLDPVCFEVGACGVGMTPEAVSSGFEDASPCFGAVEVELDRLSGTRWRVAYMTVSQTDRLVRLSPKPDDAAVVSRSSLPVGLYADGSRACVSVEQSSGLVAGQPGSGKSVFLSTLVYDLVRVPCERVILASPKARVDFQDYGALCEVCETVDEVAEVVGDLRREMERRKDLCLSLNKTHLEGADFTDQTPHITLVVDEVSVYASATREPDPGSKSKKPIPVGAALIENIRLLVAEGRFAGISVVLATQKPTADSGLTTGLRDLIGWRCSFFQLTPEAVAATLGGSARSGMAAAVPRSARGVGWLLTDEDSEPRLFKSDFANRGDMTKLLNAVEERSANGSVEPLRSPGVLYPGAEPGDGDTGGRYTPDRGGGARHYRVRKRERGARRVERTRARPPAARGTEDQADA
jgi:S-DNA-T family DNA segregation ATPase FtsK/SpoIIIE